MLVWVLGCFSASRTSPASDGEIAISALGEHDLLDLADEIEQNAVGDVGDHALLVVCYRLPRALDVGGVGREETREEGLYLDTLRLVRGEQPREHLGEGEGEGEG